MKLRCDVCHRPTSEQASLPIDFFIRAGAKTICSRCAGRQGELLVELSQIMARAQQIEKELTKYCN